MFRFANKNGSFSFRIALVLGVVFATVLGATPAQAYMAVARTTYIVQVKTGAAADVRAVIGKLGETPHDELTEVMDGFVLDMTEIEASTLRADANVIQVVADQTVSMLDTQNPTPSWGLDRIDQTNTTYDNTYNYPASAGAGVKVYVVDTGVMASDPDFTGRVETGVDLLGQNLQGADCNGHGTHVAGTIAGTKYGVAKKATIVPIRVLGCGGSGSMSTIVSAIDWIIANNPAGTPAVMSASIGGGKYQLVNDAIEKLYQSGITPVVAAGNNNADAAGYSPASSPNAITVGASDSNDTRAYFSNFGDLVDVFAPGLNIVSDNYADSTTPRTLSGTSMATPHVSGLAALYLADHPTATPAQVTAAIQAGAQAGIIVDAKSANGNYLINTKFTNAALPPVGAPTNVVVSAITATSATVTWAAPTATQAAASYRVEYKDSTATTWSSVDATTTTTNLTALTSNTTYSVRVTSIAGTTVSPASPETVFSTLADVPDPVANLRVTSVYGTQVFLAWDAPANANGSRITGYEVWIDNAGTWTKKMTSSVTTANVTGLTSNTTYSMRVVALNAIGSSLPSSTISVSTTDSTPAQVVITGLSGTTTTGTTVSWRAVTPIDTTAISYNVAVSTSTGTSVATYTTTSLSQAISGLTRYTSYVIAVTAYSGTIAGPASNNYSFRTLADVPTAPTNVTATKLSTGEINISWNSPRDNGGVAITQYKVEQFVAGAWVLVATNDVTVAKLVVASPAAGVTEQYRVSAVNSIGTGPGALVSTTGTVSAPAAPTSLTINAVTGSTTSGTLAWLAPVNNGGAAVTGYNVYRSSDNGTSWTTLVSAITTLNYNVALPPKGSTYLYAVSAVNSAGTSAKSTSVSYASATSAPAAPAAPVLSFNTDGTLKVLWSAPADNGGSPITGYKVLRLVNGTYSTVATTLPTVTTANLARDAAGVTYTLVVVATNAIGDSANSASAVIAVPAQKSTAPLNLTATSNGSAVTLTWQAPQNTGGTTITSYSIQQSTDNATTWVTLGSVNTLTVSLTMPPKGFTYLYRVAANSSAGQSDFSNIATVASKATAPGAPNMRSIGFASDGSLQVTWLAPSDNGGSPLTGFRIEYSTNGTSFSTFSTVAANVLSVSIPREAAGVRSYVRIYSVTALGESVASSTLTLATPALKASAPQNFTAVDSGTYVTLSWTAPANLGGSTSVNYTAQVSKDGGATWSSVSTVSALTAIVIRPTKGTTWQYRVVANTSAGLSDYSSVASITVATSAPSAPSWSFVGFNANGSIDLRWLAPADNGGNAITGYLVEKSYDQITWVAVNGNSSATNLSVNLPRENPGVRIFFRVSALTASATSASSPIASVLVPYLKASAPQGFSATDATSSVATSWSAPANLGGSTTVSYTVQVSKDNGTTWASAGATTATSLNVIRPAKGTTWLYRVVAYTAFGASDYSNSQSIAIAATAPTAPGLSVVLNSATNSIDARWNVSADNGGSAITGYVLQRSYDNANFTTVVAAPATTLTASVAKDAPGVRSYWRIAAVNAIGTSAYGAVFGIMMPYVAASAVQNFTAVDTGSMVTTSWTAPADLGGSPSIYYYIQYSINGGTTWLNAVSTTALAYNLARPAKGTTVAFRVVAVTAFGQGVPSQAISITSAATAPSVPSIRSFILNTDLTSTLLFNAPTDLGGSPLTGYVVEQSTNGTTWSVLSTTAVAGTPFAIAAGAPGVRIYVRVSAVNAVGQSPASYVYSVQMPFVQASAVQGLVANMPSTSAYVGLSWSAPANLGGASAALAYQVQSSADGINWTVVTSTSGFALNIVRPAKGTSLNYRVLAVTQWGLGLPSNVVSASTPTTATSSVTLVNVVRQSDLSYNLSFNKPSDLGGIATWTYKIQMLQGNVWNTVLTGTGAASQVVNLPSPASGVYVYYRIIATNSVGDSPTYTILIRG